MILKEMVDRTKRLDCLSFLRPCGLQNYSQDCDPCNSIFIVFGREAILLLRIQLPSLTVILHEEMTKEESTNLCLTKFEAPNKD